ncbi:hypothetical protein ACIBKY_31740 [Nonomuraea sp. NPDC050394]|uniref:hypothetical protein n=1 Tax=Nonomuraea TaxID=83681 RepID=UPI00379C6F09
MTSSRRRIAITIATLTLAGLTTACGGLGNAVDCASMSADLNKITQEFTTSMTSAGTDIKAIETASSDAAGKIKTLAGKHDGDLASALNDLAAVFEGIKVDEKNPASATEALGKIPDIQAKVQKACG